MAPAIFKFVGLWSITDYFVSGASTPYIQSCTRMYVHTYLPCARPFLPNFFQPSPVSCPTFSRSQDLAAYPFLNLLHLLIILAFFIEWTRVASDLLGHLVGLSAACPLSFLSLERPNPIKDRFPHPCSSSLLRVLSSSTSSC